MNIIVFSKDRAPQLELFVRSFNKYVKDFDKFTINVLYTYSNDNFRLGYDKLIGMNYPNVKYIKETNFRSNLIEIVRPDKKHTVFFVDDNVFKNPLDFYDNQMDIFDKHGDILCRSLRLHPNLTYCYTMKSTMIKPNFLHDNIFIWVGQSADFGYPMSVDGHIFKTKDIFPYIINRNYNNPNSFEGEMANSPIRIPKMICYDKSIVVNNPCNKVQNHNNNHSGSVKTDYLNDRFLEGYIISMNNIDGLENISCHQEIEIMLEKKEIIFEKNENLNVC